MSSDGESVDIFWRLRQRLRDNRVVWYADHDGELVDASAEDEWSNLTDATNYIQEQHKAIVGNLQS